MDLPEPRYITSDDLLVQIERVRRATEDPKAGVFGPGSTVWQLQCEAVNFFGGGRATLLQTAHPWVASGIAEFSDVMKNPLGRFHRTFFIVFSLVFGSLDQAVEKAHMVHHIHNRIRGRMPEDLGPFRQGSPYQANELNAMIWVFATLWETTVRMHETLLDPLTAETKERFYQEGRKFAGLFGIPDDALPAGWDDFMDYNRAMWDSPVLTVGAAGREICDGLLRGQGDNPRPKLPRWYLDFTTSTLPPRLREEFRLPFGAREQARAERTVKWLRWLYPRLPRRLRTVPAYQEALARIEGRRADFLTRSLNRVWVGRPLLVS